MQKYRNMSVWLMAVVVSIIAINPSFSQDYAIEINNNGGEVTWNAGVSGVSLVFSDKGTMDRIISTYRQAVNIPDARGIRAAQVIAEEKAKSAVIRFINEDVMSERIVTQVQNDLNSTSFTEGSAGASISNETSRQIIENVTELTRSSARGLLSGIVVLEQGYDNDLREAWVTVGISKKSRGAAALASEWLKDAPTSDSDAGNNVDNIEGHSLPGSSVQKNSGSW